VNRVKLAIALAVKAKRTWDRLPPEHRERILSGTKTTIRSYGPVVAKKAADTARTQGPVLARHVGKAVDRARKSLQ
jgi:hypothetical protein